MSNSYRRYEILLPRRFNDGRRTPNRFVTDALIELREPGNGSSTTNALSAVKPQPNPNERNSKFETTGRAGWENLRIGILHLFRASDFGFRI